MPLSYIILYQKIFQKSNPFLDPSLGWNVKTIFQILIHIYHASQVLPTVVNCSAIILALVAAIAFVARLGLAHGTGTVDYF